MPLVLATVALALAGALPDLVQLPPAQLAVVGPPYRLSFAATFANLGAGPLVILATRQSPIVPTLRADQLIGSRRIPAVGVVRYVADPTHAHFHLLGIDRYQLLRSGHLVARDEKTGFCLTDDAPRTPTAGPAVFTDPCGLDQPDRLVVSEGLSPGWADVYPPARAGQSLTLTGVPPGRYTLLNTVNPQRRIIEGDYRNNSAALQLQLGWEAGVPSIHVLAVCAANSCRAPLPGEGYR